MPRNVTADKVVGAWKAPYMGVIRHVPIYEVPPDALWESVNVMYLDGILTTREGVQGHLPGLIGGHPIGAIYLKSLAGGAFQEDAFQADAFQVAGEDFHLLVMTTQKLLTYRNGAWVSLMPVTSDAFQADAFQNDAFQLGSTEAFHATEDHQGRFASIEIDSAEGDPVLHIIGTNGLDTPFEWDGKSASLTKLTGAGVGPWRDVTSAANHIVYALPPYTVGWSEDLELSFPASNRRILAETLDEIVAVRAIGTDKVAVYKTGSLWTGTPNAGPSSQFFRFGFRGYFTGPANPCCVVDADGAHIYLTVSGRVGYFDGLNHQWIGDGVWPLLSNGSAEYAAIDEQYMGRAFGEYHAGNSQVIFYFPQQGDQGAVRGCLIVNMPDRTRGETAFGCFPGRLSVPVSAIAARRDRNEDILLFGDEVYKLGGTLDLSQPFSGYWLTGLVAAPGMEPFRMAAHETSIERGTGYGTLKVRPLYSYTLDEPSASQGTQVTLDLTQVPVAREEKGGDVRGRFFGYRADFTTPVTLRWRGARLAAYPID